MDILLIEDNDHRRVSLLRDLLSRGHRVTPCSSLEEAQEVLRFVFPSDPPLQALVVPRVLLEEDVTGLRQTLGKRFPGLRCILLEAHHRAGWLADRLERRVDEGLDVLLIEPDTERCAAMIAHMTDRGDRVTTCLSAKDAEQVLVTGTRPPDVIVSDVTLSDGNGLSFYLAASRRFPGIRWIVATPESRSREFALQS